MSRHIFTLARKLLSSRVLKALSLRRFEPQRQAPAPEPDAWLFEPPRSVKQEAGALGRQMSDLAGTLGDLHALAGRVMGEEPAPAEPRMSRIGQPIWSDALLFDGEPQPAIAAHAAPVSDHDDLLFDDDVREHRHGAQKFVPAMIALPVEGPRSHAC